MIKALQLCLILFLVKADIIAQVPSTSFNDTIRIIRIAHSDVLREKTIDSVTKLEILAGNVIVYEGATKFNCDSAIINKSLNTLEAFGNVRINQGDSLFTSSQYLKYIGTTRIAYLKRNVKLTDRKGSLTTQELEYDLGLGIGKYINGGTVVNGKTILTSREGTYYESTKDVYFKKNVDLTDPKYKIKSDSLLYNMQTRVVTFTGPTNIKSKEATIFTTQGTYDLKNGSAFFGSRTLVKDSSGRSYQAAKMALDDKSGIAQLEGKAIIKDSVGKIIITGNQIFLNKKNNSFLATIKPVIVAWEGKDTTYIAADTIFSGYTKRVISKDIIPENNSFKNDSVNRTGIKDSSNLIRSGKTEIVKSNKTDTSIRYFIAYHHVRIFNDSLQSVSDSLFYSGEDSVFRLFHDPVIWSGQNQITGDTIYIYTKNKKAERLYVFEKGLMVNKINNEFYNQISGKTINGYFKNGAIDNMRVKGSPAESIYYVQDKDSAFTGMNRADGSVINMLFFKNALNKVKFINDVHGILYPIKQLPQDKKLLKNFIWLDKRRPKNKLELFE